MSQANRSLKFKLIALTMGITFALGAAAIGILNHMASSSEDTIRKGFETYSETLNDAISAQFYERYGDVQAFALNPSLQSSSRSTIVETLNAYVTMYGIYDLILVVDAHGRLIATNSTGPDGKPLKTDGLFAKSFAEEPWFKNTLAGKTTDDKANNFSGTYVESVQADPSVSEVFGEKRLGTSFSAPIRDGHGNVIGVVSNRAGSRWFEAAFLDALANMKHVGYEQADMMLLGHDGTLLFEYASNPDVEKLDVPKHNFEVLLKLNLAAKGYEPVKQAITGKTGNMIYKNARTGIEQIVGYQPMNGPKFVESLGWIVLVRDATSDVFEDVINAKRIFYVSFAIVILLACAASYYFSINLSRRLTAMATQLSAGSNEVAQASSQISQASTELSEAAVEQAAAIQQTAASVDQVSAMVKKSADNATQSQKASGTSREAAERGQAAVQEMIQSINDISRSNSDIMSQVEDGNRQISDIVKVISEIETKTKVINDIVFQTKLLSFNASVEAARAGEQGKGFAVVAEEVGNLAQMSGNAAKEISSMLESSIQKVQGIVDATKSKVEHLIVDSRSKVENGTQVAQKCGEALNGILTSVQEVDGMVGEISSASNEQAQGVIEINKAMNQLDQVTQQNTAVSQQAATSAEQLNGQAAQLKQMVGDLFALINGGDGSAPRERASSVQRRSTSADKGSAGTTSSGSAPAKSKSKAGTVVQLKPRPKAAEPRRADSPRLAAGGSLPSQDDPRFEDV
jgi:methyl-accepting chemotaxis protein